METRKVQLSGGTTYTVSVPKTWADEHGIEAGSLLYLYPDEDGSLLVESDAHRGTDERSARVDVSTYDIRAVRETVKRMYVAGIDDITLVDRTGHDTERRRAVSDVATGLTGLEVLERTENRIVLRNLVAADSISIRKSVLRLRLIMLAMHRDAVSAVVDDDEALAAGVVERDREADKLFAVVTRFFQRALSDLREVERLGLSRTDLFAYYYVARQFERVADHAVKAARLATEREVTLSDRTAEAFERTARDALTVVEHASDVLLADADVTVAYDALADCEALVSDVEALDRELYEHEEPSEAHLAGLLLDSVRRTAEYGRNVAEVAIQQGVREHESD